MQVIKNPDLAAKEVFEAGPKVKVVTDGDRKRNTVNYVSSSSSSDSSEESEAEKLQRELKELLEKGNLRNDSADSEIDPLMTKTKQKA